MSKNKLAAAIDALSYGELLAVQEMGAAQAAQAAQAAHAAAYEDWSLAGQPYTANDADKDHPNIRLRTAEIRHRRIARVARLCRALPEAVLDAAIAASLENRHALWELLPAPVAAPAAGHQKAVQRIGS